MPDNTAPKGRVRLLDFLRGFSVISMVAYHTMYDLVRIFHVVNAPWYLGRPGYIWQQSICWVFILVSGASLHYGGRPLRRACIVLSAAALVTLSTVVVAPSESIWFGILHCLGFCMLLAGAAKKWLLRVPPALGLMASGALFVLLRLVPRGYIGLLETPLVRLPAALYSQSWLFPLGLPGAGFASADYFPLFPWLFLYLAGFFAWGLLKGRAKRSVAKPTPLEWVGRHSLVIYVLHQPVVYGLLSLLAMLGAI